MPNAGPRHVPDRRFRLSPPDRSVSIATKDATANQMLVELKRWADQEFGGVRAAFRVLDKVGVTVTGTPESKRPRWWTQ